VDTSSSNEIPLHKTSNIENKIYLKNNSHVINPILNDNSIHSPSNLFNTLNHDEDSNSYLNYNLIPNENNNILNANINNIFKKNNNLIELERNYQVNSNILKQEVFKSQNNKYLSSLYSNTIRLSNIMNLDVSNSSINTKHNENIVSSIMNRKRKIENFESDTNSVNLINNNNNNNNNKILITSKKLKTNNEINYVDETCSLINKINEPSIIDNKLQFCNNNTLENKFENNEITKPLHISLKNIENKSIYLTNDTPIKTNLSKETTNNNIINKEENNYAIPMSNILPDSYYNKNKKENESIDLTNDLKKMDIDDRVEEKARNTIIISTKEGKKTDEKKTKLVIKISKRLIKQHDILNNEKKLGNNSKYLFYGNYIINSFVKIN